MKRTVAFVAGLALVLGAGSAAAAGPAGTLTIRHQMRGCHTWSYNGNAFKAAQTIRLTRGSTITVVDNDVMSHQLIQKSGPEARFAGNRTMGHIGASSKVTFPKAGIYTFTTKAGEDYMKGVMTMGDDNVLTLKVVVS